MYSVKTELSIVGTYSKSKCVMKEIEKSNIVSVWLIAFLGTLCMESCIKDEAANKECDIISARVVGEQYEQYFAEKGKMSILDISSSQSEIKFEVSSVENLPDELPVEFEITPGAKIEPASGSLQNFKNGPVTYTVTSEDGEWKRYYRVSFSLPQAESLSFMLNFENAELSAKTNGNNYYHNFYELSSDGQRLDVWASGNEGAAMTMQNCQPEAFPTCNTDYGYMGKGLCLKTISSGSLGSMMKRPIAAGNLFLGKFFVDQVLNNTLRATRFGIEIGREPVVVTGYYKYKPGEKFTNKNMQEVVGRTDEASIYAVLYLNKDSQGNDYYLYGEDMIDLDNLLTNNPQVVRIAKMNSLPATDTWTPFEMRFEGKEVDEQKMAAMNYNLTLVFSSSKDGALFEGAIGSTLYIDEVEISFDKSRE